MKSRITIWFSIGVLLGGGWIAQAATEELFLNSDFEFPALQGKVESEDPPAEWVPFSSMPNDIRIGLTTAEFHAGKQSCRIRTLNTPGSHQGLFQAFSVKPGEEYEFVVYVRMDRLQPLVGTQWGQVSIEFRNQNEEEIKRVPGPEWRNTPSESKWTKVEMKTRVPDEAVRAHFVVTLHDGLSPGGPGQSIIVDDASVTKH